MSEHDSLTSAGYRVMLAALRRRICTGDSWRCPSGDTAVLGAPFRAGATHVVQLGPVAVAYVHNQIVNDAGEVGDRLSRVLRAEPDIADQRAEAGAIARGLTILSRSSFFSVWLDVGTVPR